MCILYYCSLPSYAHNNINPFSDVGSYTFVHDSTAYFEHVCQLKHRTLLCSVYCPLCVCVSVCVCECITEVHVLISLVPYGLFLSSASPLPGQFLMADASLRGYWDSQYCHSWVSLSVHNVNSLPSWFSK